MFLQSTVREFSVTSCLLLLGGPLSADEPSGGAIATSGSFTFRLSIGKEITGYTMDKASAKIILAGSELDVPMNLVESIRFEPANSGRVRVELSNGDSLSGQLVPGQFEVVADWGKVKINSGSLAEIQRAKLSASQTTVTGTRQNQENVPAVRVDSATGRSRNN